MNIYNNPAKKEFPEGYENWQFDRIKNALRWYAIYGGKGKGKEYSLSFNEIAYRIEKYTGVVVGEYVINRCLTGYYGKDADGNWKQPETSNLHAIVSFLLSEEKYGLNLHILKARQYKFDLPIELLNFFQSEQETENICTHHQNWSAVYSGSVDSGKIVKSITLYMKVPQKGDFIKITEFINVRENSKDNSRVEIIYDGWGVILPEGHILILMKERFNGENQIITTSNKFNFNQTEFFAVVKDRKVNFCDPFQYTGYEGFCNMLGKAIIFNKLNNLLIYKDNVPYSEISEGYEGSTKESEDIGKKKPRFGFPERDDSRRSSSVSLNEVNSRVERIVMNENELGIRLIEAAKEPFDHGEEVKRLLFDMDAPVNFQEKSTGATALHLATSFNDIDTVKIIINHPNVDLLIRDKKGRLPSEIAESVNPHLAQFLIEKEAVQAKARKIIPCLRHNIPDDSNDPNP